MSNAALADLVVDRVASIERRVKQLESYETPPPLPYIHVSTMGAVGDDTTDDTAAVQRGLDTLFALGGGSLIFDRKAYRVANILLRSNVALIGTGPESMLRMVDGAKFRSINGSRADSLARAKNTYTFDPTTSAILDVGSTGLKNMAAQIGDTIVASGTDFNDRAFVVTAIGAAGDQLIVQPAPVAESAPVYAATTLTFNGTTITDSAAGMTGIGKAGGKVAITGSTSNNKTVDIVSGAAGTLTTVQTLVAETPVSVAASDLTFNAVDHSITATATDLTSLGGAGAKVLITGAAVAGNNQVVTLVGNDGLILIVAETIFNEAAGAAVTLKRQITLSRLFTLTNPSRYYPATVLTTALYYLGTGQNRANAQQTDRNLVTFYAENFLIRGLTIDGNNSVNTSTDGGNNDSALQACITLFAAKRGTIEQCSILNGPLDGIVMGYAEVGGCDQCVIRSNAFSGHVRVSLVQEAGANNTFEGNRILHAGSGAALDIEGDIDGTINREHLAQYNLIESTTNAGIATLSPNLVDASHLMLLNNVIRMIDTTSSAVRVGIADQIAGSIIRGNVFINNDTFGSIYMRLAGSGRNPAQLDPVIVEDNDMIGAHYLYGIESQGQQHHIQIRRNRIQCRQFGQLIRPYNITIADNEVYLADGDTATDSLGTMAAGSATCILVEVGTFTNGQTVMVPGAGVDGVDLVTTISAGGGTLSLTLATPATTAVTAVRVVGRCLPTTGTVAANSTALTVASAIGYIVNTFIVVAGAGENGTDHRTVIKTIVGNVITMTDPAFTAVMNALVYPNVALIQAYWNVQSVYPLQGNLVVENNRFWGRGIASYFWGRAPFATLIPDATWMRWTDNVCAAACFGPDTMRLPTATTLRRNDFQVMSGPVRFASTCSGSQIVANHLAAPGARIFGFAYDSTVRVVSIVGNTFDNVICNFVRPWRCAMSHNMIINAYIDLYFNITSGGCGGSSVAHNVCISDVTDLTNAIVLRTNSHVLANQTGGTDHYVGNVHSGNWLGSPPASLVATTLVDYELEGNTWSPVHDGDLDVVGTLSQNGSAVPTLDMVAGGFTAALSAAITDAGTTTAPGLLALSHRSSGTPAAGFGLGINLQAETDNHTLRVLAQLIATLVVATDGSRTSRLDLNVIDTATRRALRLETNGAAAMMGLYNVAAVARQTVTGSRASGAALQDLLTKLATLGAIIDGSSA